MKKKSKILKDKNERLYRLVDGKREYLTLKESYEHMKKKAYYFEQEMYRVNGVVHLREHQLHWKKDEIDKLKRENQLYQLGYLQDKEPLQLAVARIARAISERERYTKKQMVDRIEDILNELGTSVPVQESELLKQLEKLEELANEH